jgi:predicted ester cyclase
VSGIAAELAEKAWAAIESGNAEQLRSMFHPEAELMTATGSGQGVDFIVGVFTRHRQSYPDLTHELTGSLEGEDGRAVARELIFVGTHKGELRNPRTGEVIPPTGKRISWQAAEHIRVQGDRIVSWRAYFDRMAIMAQFQEAKP